MKPVNVSADNLVHRPFPLLVLITIGWIAAVLLFASQWYAYDRIHSSAGPFVFYLWWSWYMWAVLTPFVLWFSNRHPIEIQNWKSAIPLHIGTSVVLTVIQVSVESFIGWARQAHDFSFDEGLLHYFSQHTQLNLLTYWLLVAIAQFYRVYDQARKRQVQAAQLKARLAQAQLDVLRMQLQPHFLFNTLQAATVLIHEDPDGAEDILLRLSQLLRVSLDELHVQEVPLTREMEFLESYVGIQQRRFGDRLRFDFQIDESVQACAVPTLILQPLVENAVRHGIGRHKERDVVTVRAFTKAGHLQIEVRNEASTLNLLAGELAGTGTGLANTQARLKQLYDDQQSLELFNINPKGVCVALTMPIRLTPVEPLQFEESQQ